MDGERRRRGNREVSSPSFPEAVAAAAGGLRLLLAVRTGVLLGRRVRRRRRAAVGLLTRRRVACLVAHDRPAEGSAATASQARCEYQARKNGQSDGRRVGEVDGWMIVVPVYI